MNPEFKRATDEPVFWDERYRTGKTPWDFGTIPEGLRNFLVQEKERGRVLIPGCGSGYEVEAFCRAGWDVLGVDFSEAAVTRARKLLGQYSSCVIQANFFDPAVISNSYDVIYECTFLCALPPQRWQSCVQRILELLRPSGRWLGFFFYGQEADSPPYPLSPEWAKKLLSGNFRAIEDLPVRDSLPLFAGRERWQIWQRAA